ncbi:hypothetical protein PanWU01x14_037940, partial [Parasponia andersonii]
LSMDRIILFSSVQYLSITCEHLLLIREVLMAVSKESFSPYHSHSYKRFLWRNSLVSSLFFECFFHVLFEGSFNFFDCSSKVLGSIEGFFEWSFFLIFHFDLSLSSLCFCLSLWQLD